MTNCRLDDPVFERGIRDFLAVWNVVKTFRDIRILQISTRPFDFWSTMCNEGELLEKFNIQLVPIPMPELTDEIKRVKSEEKAEVEAAGMGEARSFFADWTIRHPDVKTESFSSTADRGPSLLPEKNRNSSILLHLIIREALRRRQNMGMGTYLWVEVAFSDNETDRSIVKR